MVSSKFQNYGNSLTDKAGEMLAEAFVKQGKAEGIVTGKQIGRASCRERV